MIFQHTLDKVLDGSKTSTCRLSQPGWQFIYDPEDHQHIVMNKNNRIIYRIGQERAVQPGRGQKGVARIRITDIRHPVDVRLLKMDTILAEGFTSLDAFLLTWCRMHAPHLHPDLKGELSDWGEFESSPAWLHWLLHQDDDLFKAIKLEFERITP